MSGFFITYVPFSSNFFFLENDSGIFILKTIFKYKGLFSNFYKFNDVK